MSRSILGCMNFTKINLDKPPSDNEEDIVNIVKKMNYNKNKESKLR